MKQTGREKPSRLIWNLDAVHDGKPEDTIGWFGHLLCTLRQGLQDGRLRPAAHAAENGSRVGAHECCCERVTTRKHLGQTRPADGGRAALDDGAMKQAVAGGRHHLQSDAVGAGGRSCERDLLRIAAERRDVVLHPDQSRALIHQPIVSRGMRGIFRHECRVDEEAKWSQPVIGRDDDRTGLLGEAPSVVRGEIRGRSNERPGVQPHEHGHARGHRRLGHPDIQLEAVFHARHRTRSNRGAIRRWRDRGEPTRPRNNRLRRLPAVAAGGRCGKRDAEERAGRAKVLALDFSMIGRHDAPDLGLEGRQTGSRPGYNRTSAQDAGR